tara:strand:+ start:2863 stop:3513 length:651 start_codon:yes stop_codon:yes gene_type:complete
MKLSHINLIFGLILLYLLSPYWYRLQVPIILITIWIIISFVIDERKQNNLENIFKNVKFNPKEITITDLSLGTIIALLIYSRQMSSCRMIDCPTLFSLIYLVPLGVGIVVFIRFIIISKAGQAAGKFNYNFQPIESSVPSSKSEELSLKEKIIRAKEEELGIGEKWSLKDKLERLNTEYLKWKSLENSSIESDRKEALRKQRIILELRKIYEAKKP